MIALTNIYLFVEEFCCRGKTICNGTFKFHIFFINMRCRCWKFSLHCKTLYQLLLTEKFPLLLYIQYNEMLIQTPGRIMRLTNFDELHNKLPGRLRRRSLFTGQIGEEDVGRNEEEASCCL